MAEFTENEVKPIAAGTDAKTLYPRENISCSTWVSWVCASPRSTADRVLTLWPSAICIEELSKQCASTGDIVATHNGLCCDPILTHGTEGRRPCLPMLSTVTRSAPSL